MSKTKNKNVILLIADGLSLPNEAHSENVKTPNLDRIAADFPFAELSIPKGMTPEETFMSIGAGSLIQAGNEQLNAAISSGEFFENHQLIDSLQRAKESGKALHLIGLLSDGGIHSSIETLFALLRAAKREGLSEVYVHCILDGIDADKRTADIYVEALELKINDIGLGRIASLCGRFYAMDSDENWERTVRVYTMLVHSEGERARDAVEAIRNSFVRGIDDQYIAPVVIEDEEGNAVGRIKHGDAVIVFNHRDEGINQLITALTRDAAEDNSGLGIDLTVMVETEGGGNVSVMFDRDASLKTLAEVFTENGISNMRIADDRGWQLVTNHFNNGIVGSGDAEMHSRIAENLQTHAVTRSEGSNFKITDRLLRNIESETAQVTIASLMMPPSDLNGEAVSDSLGYIDTCIGGVFDAAVEKGCHLMIVLAGSASAHGTPLVSVVHPGNASRKLKPKARLNDVAPTLLSLLGLEIPVEMSGSDLCS